MGLGPVELDENSDSGINFFDSNAMAPAAWTEGTTLSQGGPLVEVLQLSSINTVVENGDPTYQSSINCNLLPIRHYA